MMFSKFLSVAALALAASTASAQVASSRGELTDGAIQSAALSGASFDGTCGESTDTSSYHFWTFTAVAGDVVTIDVNRVTGELDPIMSLWSGSVIGSPLSDWTSATSSGVHTLLSANDDGQPPAVPGPFGDPRISNFVIPVTGTYSILVAGACSAAGPTSYAYSIDVQGSSTDDCARVTFRGDLSNGGTQSSALRGVVGDCGEYASSATFHFWSFLANAGDSITVDVNRVTGELDPYMSVWSGSLAGDPLSAWSDANTSSLYTSLAADDDSQAPAVPGPFGDPRVNFVAPATGTYTVLIASACSLAGQTSYGYTVAVTGSTIAEGCRADFDGSGSVAVPDIFAFLSAWFAGCP